MALMLQGGGEGGQDHTFEYDYVLNHHWPLPLQSLSAMILLPNPLQYILSKTTCERTKYFKILSLLQVDIGWWFSLLLLRLGSRAKCCAIEKRGFLWAGSAKSRLPPPILGEVRMETVLSIYEVTWSQFWFSFQSADKTPTWLMKLLLLYGVNLEFCWWSQEATLEDHSRVMETIAGIFHPHYFTIHYNVQI